MHEVPYRESVIETIKKIEQSEGNETNKALSIPVNSWLEGARLAKYVKIIIRDCEAKHARVWRWRYPISGGHALSEHGKKSGFELRVSYFKKENT